MLYHDIFAMDSAKAVEYLIAVIFLFLFVPFWRYVNAERGVELAPLRAAEPAPGWLGQIAGWFHVPEHLHFHPGHSWARIGEGELVSVGIDDFANRLVGRAAVALPPVGSRLSQGERAWSLVSDGKSVDMLSPVDGIVVAVNERLRDAPDLVEQDPYGEGWLLEVRSPRIAANAKQLLRGSLARRWMEEASEGLQILMSPDLGRVYQDGGLPVSGMARNLDPARWDSIARRFLLT
ncbi:MAG: glycine cleavage system protein H [Candidatus Rokubacteria bacterium]|nr:glycine cleavage system protein H [Candidatus Rokubacteria bacterium]